MHRICQCVTIVAVQLALWEWARFHLYQHWTAILLWHSRQPSTVFFVLKHITSELKYGHQPHSTWIFKLQPTIDYLHPRRGWPLSPNSHTHTSYCHLCNYTVINKWQPYALYACLTSTCSSLILMYTKGDQKPTHNKAAAKMKMQWQGSAITKSSKALRSSCQHYSTRFESPCSLN